MDFQTLHQCARVHAVILAVEMWDHQDKDKDVDSIESLSLSIPPNGPVYLVVDNIFKSIAHGITSGLSALVKGLK
jgi:hypothetical protein